jgi:hypothetical protein
MRTPNTDSPSRKAHQIACGWLRPRLLTIRKVLMGTSDCRYESQKHALDCPLPSESAMHFEVNGSMMKGTMRLRDGTLWRKIALHRVDEK